MEHIETFVTASVHVSKHGAKFIRVRFQVGDGMWLTAFNPTGVASVEWVERISRTTGSKRIQTRFPVRVSFARSAVIGSDVAEACAIQPRDFTPHEMEPADPAALAALGAAAPAAPAASAAPAAPAQDADDEPLA